LEEAEKKNDQKEPERPEQLPSPLKNSKSERFEESPPHKMVFHDFDYINPGN
jgi:hypothetical protein